MSWLEIYLGPPIGWKMIFNQNIYDHDKNGNAFVSKASGICPMLNWTFLDYTKRELSAQWKAKFQNVRVFKSTSRNSIWCVNYHGLRYSQKRCIIETLMVKLLRFCGFLFGVPPKVEVR